MAATTANASSSVAEYLCSAPLSCLLKKLLVALDHHRSHSVLLQGLVRRHLSVPGKSLWKQVYEVYKNYKLTYVTDRRHPPF